MHNKPSSNGYFIKKKFEGKGLGNQLARLFAEVRIKNIGTEERGRNEEYTGIFRKGNIRTSEII